MTTQVNKLAMVHPTACVEEGVTLGEGVKVWHFCHVRQGAVLGAGVVLGQSVHVASGVVVGARCRIQNNVSIYQGVELAEDVFVGPSAVFTNVKFPRAHVSRREEFAPTSVAKGASIGANVTIVCGVSLGAYCMIGAGAVVTKDVLPYALMVGNPATQLGWVCACGERLDDVALHCLRCDSMYKTVQTQDVTTLEML